MLNNILDELKLNALVITDPYNMRHVSGFRGGEGALYISTVLQQHMFAYSLKAFCLAADRLFLFLKLIIFY